MSSKLTAAKGSCCLDGIDEDAATGGVLAQKFGGCDLGSDTKDPGIINDFASSEGTIAPSLVASNAGDDTIEHKPNVTCEGTLIAHKAGAYGGEPGTGSASSSATPKDGEEWSKIDEPAISSASSPAIPQDEEELSELNTNATKSSLSSGPADSEKTQPSLIPEVWILIVRFAMKSDSDGAFIFDCGTGRDFKPNVPTQLLRVNENIFFFDHFGSDLKVIDKSVGLSKCLLGGCPTAMIEPRIKKMALYIGSEEDMYMGSLASSTFQFALRALRYNIHVEELLLHILPYAFLSPERAKEFAAELKKIKLSGALTITGPASQGVYDDVYHIAAALGMNPRPIERCVQHDYDRGLIQQGYSYHRFEVPRRRNRNKTGGRIFGGSATARASSERAEAIAK
ncbi:MAG: hypothetical protein Q9191_003267 [Dirinaria sp. TL-2023a]